MPRRRYVIIKGRPSNHPGVWMNKRKTSPELLQSLGMQWLMRYFAGETITNITKTSNTYRGRVLKLMKAAALTLIDAAQEQLLTDVFPLTKKVLLKALEQQLNPKPGEPLVNTELAERVLKALYITDAPQLKTALVREVGGSDGTVEEQTLEGFVARRVLQPARPTPSLEGTVIDSQPVKDVHSN